MTERGHQRHTIERLKAWESLGYGMFIHFGMSTFDGDEFSRGDLPSTAYAPDRLDVDQWVSVARDAGMRYAVLTTKHVSGHCLWPTDHCDYHVGTSSSTVDVVGRFVAACQRTGVLPGFYYCSWDNHNRFGSVTPTVCDHGPGSWEWKYTTRAYEDFQQAQLEELVARYGAPMEWWIDIPFSLSRGYQRHLYDRLAQLTPDAVIMFNTGIGDGGDQPTPDTWPTDLISIETRLPPTSAMKGALQLGHVPWRTVLGQRHYLPGEVSDTVLSTWFWTPEARPKSDGELLGLYALARARGTNLLLDVAPDRHGVLPQEQIDAVLRLRRNRELVGL
jgi:alpha-L-fucosidase